MQSTVDIRTKDGRRIWLNCYTPAESVGKVMIIAPMGGVTKDYYDSFARFARKWGYHVVSFDYRGIGSSRPEHLRGYQATMQQWAVQDLDAVILYVKNCHPKQEIVCVGHCIGGEILGLAQASQYVTKLVLVNSALSCKKLWSWKDRFRIIAIKVVVNTLNRVFGYFPGKKMGMTDMPGGVMSEWANWCNHPNGLFDLFPDNNYRKLQIPLLAFSFSDDWHGPPKAVQELLNRFSNAVINWQHIHPHDLGVRRIGRTGFFHPQMRTTLWLRTMQWLNEGELQRRNVVKQ